MRIHTRLIISMANPSKILLEEGFDYVGSVAELKGATSAETNLQASQSAFYTQLTNSYAQQFQNQSNILQSLQNTWGPILAAGPGQQGFTPQEVTGLNTQATEGTAAEYQKALKATNEQLASEGGGNAYVPTGANDAIRGGIATSAAQQESSQLLGIQNANYAQGNSNFLAASSALSGAAGLYNPTGYAGAANTGGANAFSSASTIQQQNQAASPWSTVGGILGGAASSFAGNPALAKIV